MSKIKALATRRYGSLGSPAGRGSLGAADLQLESVSVSSAGSTWGSIEEQYNPLALVQAGIAAAQAAISSATAGAAEKTANQFASGNSISMADFKNVGGVCTATNFPALRHVTAMQAQMNRIAEKKGWGKIAVDGKVGTGTLALFKKIQAAANGDIMGDTSSCLYIAADADVLTEQLATYANALGAPAKVSGPPAVATVTTITGKTLSAPPGSGIAASLSSAFAGMSSGQKLALAGMTGGIAFLIHKKLNKKGKKRG